MLSDASPGSPRRSGLALLVLALLAERPMHPYLMQRLIRERGKDTVVNVARRNSVNQAVERLRRDGLVEVHDTRRDGSRPERTIYRITDAGRLTLWRWMRELLSSPVPEFPQLPAGLSLVGLFAPDEVRHWLEHRVEELARSLSAMPDDPPGIPRVLVVEDEYRRAMLTAELAWVGAIVDELRAGTLTWDPEQLRNYAVPGSA